MPDLPTTPLSTEWDSLVDEAIWEARRCLQAIGRAVDTRDVDDLGFVAGQWMELGRLVLARQRNELAFEEWRDSHDGGG